MTSTASHMRRHLRVSACNCSQNYVPERRKVVLKVHDCFESFTHTVTDGVTLFLRAINPVSLIVRFGIPWTYLNPHAPFVVWRYRTSKYMGSSRASADSSNNSNARIKPALFSSKSASPVSISAWEMNPVPELTTVRATHHHALLPDPHEILSPDCMHLPSVTVWSLGMCSRD